MTAPLSDERVFQLWDLWQEANVFFHSKSGEEGIDRLNEIEDDLHEKMDTSINALGAVLIIEANNREDVEGLHLASLAAIRPQLVGAIAEAADRALAQNEEARA